MKYGSLACVKHINLFQNELHPSPHLFVQLSSTHAQKGPVLCHGHLFDVVCLKY